MPVISIALALAQFAPQLMRYFGAGDASTAIAQQVVGIAQQVSGASTPAEALEAIRASAALQAQFAQHTLDVDAGLEKAYIDDRADARKRDIALAQAGRVNNRANAMVAIDAIGLIACLVVLAVYRQQLPGEAVALISTIAGIFGLCLRDAHQFEFGSSRTSRDKDETISTLSKGAAASK